MGDGGGGREGGRVVAVNIWYIVQALSREYIHVIHPNTCTWRK